MKVIILPSDNKDSTQGIRDAMAKIEGVPVFFHTIMLFEKRGFYDFVICDNSEGHEIRDYLNSNLEKIKGLKIRILKFPNWVKSVKMLSCCQKYGVENAFFVAPNDVITDLDPEKMLSTHRQNAKVGTIFVAEERKYFSALGESEKEKYEAKIVNSGFYIFEPEATEYTHENATIDTELLISLAENDELLTYSDGNFIERPKASRLSVN